MHRRGFLCALLGLGSAVALAPLASTALAQTDVRPAEGRPDSAQATPRQASPESPLRGNGGARTVAPREDMEPRRGARRGRVRRTQRRRSRRTVLRVRY